MLQVLHICIAERIKGFTWTKSYVWIESKVLKGITNMLFEDFNPVQLGTSEKANQTHLKFVSYDQVELTLTRLSIML